MNRDWLWDRDIPLEDIKRILSDENDKRFVEIAALLLSRKNTPSEVFSQYLDQVIFVRNWPRIKKRMRKDAWAVNRIYFWDAICQKVSATLKEKGVSVHEAKPWTPVNDVYTSVGEQVRLERQKAGLTQAALAASTGSTQQMISMVEAGQSNLSLSTLQRIAEGMGKKIVIELK